MIQKNQKIFVRSDRVGNSNLDLRDSLFRGQIHVFSPRAESVDLVACIRGLVSPRFDGRQDIDRVHETVSDDEVYAQVQQVRSILVKDPSVRERLGFLVNALGFDRSRNLVDLPRLRCVLPGKHGDTRAAPAYGIHRDTWYANPRCQINWWIPLHDIEADQGMDFFPDYFDQPIRNSSSGFTFSDWHRTVGFQRASSAETALYPATIEPIHDQRTLAFPLVAGSVLLFSAAHLHRTHPHDSFRTRFSVDFRTVDEQDLLDGRGAPDVDNASEGQAEATYRYLREV